MSANERLSPAEEARVAAAIKLSGDETVEQEIQRKGLTAPRVTPADIEANIAAEFYFTAAQGVAGAVPLDVLADRFMRCPVPVTCRPDGTDGDPQRVGTNLLSHAEAKEMLGRVLAVEPGAEALGLLTFCVLLLRNGYTVHGVSACASPENFNVELGRRIARENAVREIWPLMGYALRCELAKQDAR